MDSYKFYRTLKLRSEQQGEKEPLKGYFAKVVVEFTHDEILAFFKESANESNEVEFAWFIKLYTAVLPQFYRVKTFIRPPECSPELDQYIRSSIIALANSEEAKDLWTTGGFTINRRLKGLVVSNRHVKYLLKHDVP